MLLTKKRRSMAKKLRNIARIKTSVFVSPYTHVKNAGRLKNLIKVNRSEVEPYMNHKGSLREILLDVSAFDYNPEAFNPDAMIESLGRLQELIRTHPHEIGEALRLLHENGGYTSEIAKIMESIGVVHTRETADDDTTNLVLMTLTSSELCVSNVPWGGADPRDPSDIPDDDDPGSGGEDPPGEDPPGEDPPGEDPPGGGPPGRRPSNEEGSG
jgi:hypothetical protein